MNIDELTIGQARQLANLFGGDNCQKQRGLDSLLGKKVIIRTYSAGVHYGELIEKSGTEVILKNSRRLYYWKTTNKGISLSEVSKTGLHKDSKICAVVDLIWLDAIEIIPCEKEAIKNIEGQDVYKA